jgi:hypothetical protein
MNAVYLQTARVMAQVAALVFVDDMRIEVKVEVNFLMRGTVHRCVESRSCQPPATSCSPMWGPTPRKSAPQPVRAYW